MLEVIGATWKQAGCLLLAVVDVAISHISWAWRAMVRCRGAHCPHKALQHPLTRCSTLSRCPGTSCVWLYLCIFVLCRTRYLGLVLPWVELNYWIVFLLLGSLPCCHFSVLLMQCLVHVPELQGLWAGFGTPPPGELLLILVTFLGMEQVPLSVLKKTRCAQGLCLLPLVIAAVAFLLAGP